MWSRSAAPRWPVSLGVLAVGLLLETARAGMPVDKPLSELQFDGSDLLNSLLVQPDPAIKAYATEVGYATGGVGVAIAILFGLLLSITIIVACCRCCRMKRRDRAVSQGSFLGDKKFPKADYAYQDIGDEARKHARILWAVSLLLVIGYIACGASAYAAALKTQKTIEQAYDDTDIFLTKVQKSICTVGDDDGAACDKASLARFCGCTHAACDFRRQRAAFADVWG
jgi:hypothetical protein